MDYHHHYKPRDFDFAQRLVTLRKRSGLTQRAVALHIGVSDKAIRNWEGGSHYPTDTHLKMLIGLYLDNDGFTSGYEQEEAHQLWEQLSESTPHRIGVFEEQWFAALLRERQSGRNSHRQRSSLLFPRHWSEALDVSLLYGRTDELTELEHWLLKDRCRLVAVLGMGGIGKTTLAVKLAQQMAPHFACVLWRSLHNAPSLEELLHDWLQAISERRYTHLPQDINQLLALLVKLLQERRCLLVLDNLETLFQEGVLEGRYRVGYEGYAMLIRCIAETTHQSCLLLTSRELFADLGGIRNASMRVLRLGSLQLPACQQMLQDKGLFGDQLAWRELVQCYGGNPLALKIAAEVVHELFGGDIAAFLDEGLMAFHGIRQLLAQQFERLSGLEQALLYWLAVEREPVTLQILREDLLHPVTKREVLEAMHSLRSRCLVERAEHGAVFMLQPVVLEYVTERLVELVSDEICNSKLELLRTHALLQAQAKDSLRSSQASLILQPVLDRLVSQFGSQERLEAQLESILQQLRTLPSAQQGYGAGNVINLLVRLNGHVKRKDCSHLTVWQADLRRAEAQDCTFVGSDLAGSAFMEAIEGILSVALSPNGLYVAGGTNNGEIHVWRVADGQPLWTTQGHVKLAWSLAFHPDSTKLASGGYDGLVKIWDVSSGQCLSILQGHTKWVGTLAFHPAGKLLATGSDDGSVRLWDLTEGRCINEWHGLHREVWSVAFSPDGWLLASGGYDGIVEVWSLASEQRQWRAVAHHGSSVPSLAFSPDGKLLASGGEDTLIKLWDASSGESHSTLSGHTDVIRSVAFHTQSLLASGSDDHTVKLWQIGPKGEARPSLNTLQGHNGWVWSVAFGLDGLLASGGHDGVVKLWQITGRGEKGVCLRTLRGHSRLITSIAFSPDGKHLVSGERNGTVRMWETESGQSLLTLSRQAGEAYAVAFRPDGQLFVHSLLDRTIKLWDAKSGQCLRILKGHQGEIWSVAFSPDGCFLLSGSLDMTIKHWEVSSGRCLATFEGHNNWVWSVACSPDGKLLASGDVDGIVKLWEISSGQCLRTLQGSHQAIVALAFTPDGSKLLSSNAWDFMTVWDVESGQCLETLSGMKESYWPGSVAFRPDGGLLAAACTDQTVKAWDVSSGEVLHTFFCHAGRPGPVTFSADGRMLASGTDQGAVIVWEVQSGKCLLTLRSDRPYERMNINGATGITEAQKASLKILGAIDEQ